METSRDKFLKFAKYVCLTLSKSGNSFIIKECVTESGHLIIEFTEQGDFVNISQGTHIFDTASVIDNVSELNINDNAQKLFEVFTNSIKNSCSELNAQQWMYLIQYLIILNKQVY